MNSKKILSLVLAGTMALGICSCDGYFAVKPDGPTEVEEETTTEEETTEIIIVTTEATSETTTEATTESSDNTSETSAKNTSEATAPASLNSNMEGTIFVSFKGKLAYEVKENLINMTKITRGVTMDNYADVFTDYPNDTVYGEDYKYCTYYWDSVARNSTEGINHVMVHIVRKTDGLADLRGGGAAAPHIRPPDGGHRLFLRRLQRDPQELLPLSAVHRQNPVGRHGAHRLGKVVVHAVDAVFLLGRRGPENALPVQQLP